MLKFFLCTLVSGLIVLSFGGCEEDKDNSDLDYMICGIENPEWFTALVEKAESDPYYYGGSSLIQYEYEGTYIFYFSIPVSSCMYCQIYDCDGNIIELASCDPLLDFIENQSNGTLLWPRYG
ncbi:MAG: hypothetical protein HQ556_11155 [Candidatus Marinimicrobia bacterium]|nr:hypothetical protein [Candidatus Neomarinimicrobiota bacterium]